jgi:hypothetical protein
VDLQTAPGVEEPALKPKELQISPLRFAPVEMTSLFKTVEVA